MEGIIPSDPPPEVLQRRKEGWRSFIYALRDAFQDPVKGAILAELGARLAQDRVPGQSRTDQISRAIQGGMAAGGDVVREAQAQAERERKARQEEEGLQIRREQVDVQREGVAARRADTEARRQIARGRVEAEANRLDKQLRQSALQHEERMAALKRRNELLGRQLQLEEESAGRKFNAQLWDAVISRHQNDLDPVPIETLMDEYRRVREAATTEDPALIGFDASSRARQVMAVGEKYGLSRDQLVEKIRASGLNPAQMDALLRYIPEDWSGGKPAPAPASRRMAPPRERDLPSREELRREKQVEETRRVVERQEAHREKAIKEKKSVGAKANLETLREVERTIRMVEKWKRSGVRPRALREETGADEELRKRKLREAEQRLRAIYPHLNEKQKGWAQRMLRRLVEAE